MFSLLFYSFLKCTISKICKFTSLRENSNMKMEKPCTNQKPWNHNHYTKSQLSSSLLFLRKTYYNRKYITQWSRPHKNNVKINMFEEKYYFMQPGYRKADWAEKMGEKEEGNKWSTEGRKEWSKRVFRVSGREGVKHTSSPFKH